MKTTRELLEMLLKAINEAEIADHVPRELLLEIDEHLKACSPGCLGWAHFNVGTDREGIQRCDACNIFVNDQEAKEAHDRHCSCGAGVEVSVQSCNFCLRPIFDSDEVFITSDEKAACSRCHRVARAEWKCCSKGQS